MMAIKCGKISIKVLPFKTTIRITAAKWLIGLRYDNICPQPGMLSMGVKTPLIILKTSTKKESQRNSLLLSIGIG